MLNIASPAAAFRWWRLPCARHRARAHGVHHQQRHQGPSAGAAAASTTLTDDEARQQIEELTAGYAGQGRVLRRPARPRDREDRGVAVPRAGDRAHERLQDQRVRGSPRRHAVRARGGEPDARVARRVALLQRRLQGGVRAGVPGHSDRVREDMGLDNVIVMVPFCRTLEEADRVLDDAWPSIGLERGRERARGLRDVRDPVERHPGRRVRRAVRRLLDRLATTSPSSSLGVDRDSTALAHLFDERNDAVKSDDPRC